MAAGTLNSELPKGGVGLSGGFKLHVISVTAPVGTSQTSFTITVDGVTTESRICGVIPVESTAADLGVVYVTPTANTLTIGFASQNLAGTETFHIAYQTR